MAPEFRNTDLWSVELDKFSGTINHESPLDILVNFAEKEIHQFRRGNASFSISNQSLCLVFLSLSEI